ncbi:MAG: Fe-S cluster assembly protein SufD [Halobacteriales archaeon]|tara:strand:- start:756 stop:1967 length:1212 start_codon:yes stop_codon:yes gene_type:complete
MANGVDLELTDEVISQISEGLEEPKWLLETRLDAASALDRLEFPKVISTPGRIWTDLADLDFENLIDPLTQKQETFRDEIKGVEILSFADAVKSEESLVQENFGTVVDPKENYLVALSTALFTGGTVIRVPEKTNIEKILIQTKMESKSLFDYTLVVAEKSSSATIVTSQETGEGSEGDKYYGGIVELIAKENSQIKYGSLQNLSEDTYKYSMKRGSTDKNAKINWIEGDVGSRLSKTTVETELNGDGSETKIVCAFYGHEDQHIDVDAKVWHNAENTIADLVTRGVVDDHARSVYEGTQFVGQEAWNTSSYQRESTLMLSDESEADASPKLIINNHDTSASHSATVGQIDKNSLLYMRTRGIPEKIASNMLVKGFFGPIYEEITVDEFRDDLRNQIEIRLRT